MSSEFGRAAIIMEAFWRKLKQSGVGVDELNFKRELQRYWRGDVEQPLWLTSATPCCSFELEGILVSADCGGDGFNCCRREDGVDIDADAWSREIGRAHV